MKYKISLGLTSTLLLIFTIIIGISQYGLVLSEYSFFASTTELYYLPVIQTLFPICAVLTTAFIIAFIISLKLSSINGKKFWLFFISSIVIVILAICITIGVTYQTALFDEYYPDTITINTNIDEEYSRFFPYFDDLLRSSFENSYYLYSRCEIPEAVYAHIQNYTFDTSDVFYDVEYFQSDNAGLLKQYRMQKATPVIFTSTTPIYLEGVECDYNNIDYVIYQHNDYYEIRIVNDISYFSVVCRNFNNIMEYNEETFIQMAIEQYAIMQNDAQNARGESRSIWDAF